MKKIITYSIILLVVFAFNYKAVSYLMDISDSSIAFMMDFDYEKEKTESEKSEEKNEKKEFSEYLFDSKLHSFLINYKLGFNNLSAFIFISSDHSKSVYMPPELA